MNAPRITYVITDLHTGGVPLHLLRLAVGVRDRGFVPTVVSLTPGGAVADRLSSESIPTYSCNARGARDLPAIRRLAQRLRESKPDIVHALLFHANLASRLAIRLAGIAPERLICEIQTVEIERRWHLLLGGLTHALGRCVVGNSPSVVEHLQRKAHMSPDRLRCIPGGVDVERIASAQAATREELGIPRSNRVVLWVGRLDPVKGLDDLIDAFATVAAARDAILLLAGEGAYEPALRRRIESHKLEAHVRLLGRRSDIPSLLKLADVFVLPSRTEGMPNAILEAMAARCPVITTDVPGCHDLVTHQRTGLLVDYGNTRALSGAILRVLDDPLLAARLGDAAERHVRDHYTLARCVDRYITLYRESL